MRIPSPVTGSTLITSMPRSARIIGPNGPARYCPKSMSRSPASGPVPFVWSVTSRASRDRGHVAGVGADLAPHLDVLLGDTPVGPADLARRADEADGGAGPGQ